LHIAVRYNQVEVLNYLLTECQKPWNLNYKNNDDETPLKLAISGKFEQCLRMLASFESRKSLMKALILSVRNDAPNLLAFLLKECQIDPNFPDKDNMTPLRWAAFNGYKQCLKELLLHGARDDLDQFGQNIVFYASRNGHLDCLELLKKANADFSVVNYEGLSASDKTTDKACSRFINQVRQMQQQFRQNM